MKRFMFTLSAVVLTLSLSAVAQAAAGPARARLDAFATGLHSLTGHFSQTLTDLKQMDREFKVSEQGERDGLAWLRLTSTAKDPQFAYADLGFDANGLARMTFKDQLGSTTDIRFSHWQRNVAIPPAVFIFVPPKGADVIGDAPVLQVQPLKN